MGNKSPTRRQAIKSLIAGSTTVGLSSQIVSGVSDNQPSGSETVLLRGSASDPVSPSDIRDVQQELTSDITVNSESSVQVFGEPIFDYEDQYVSFYVCKVDENGKPMTHIGYSPKTRSEYTLSSTDRATKIKKRFEESDTIKRYSGEYGVSSTGVGSYWDRGAIVEASRGDRNNGDNLLSILSYPYYYTGPNGTNGEYWACKGTYRAVPESHTTNKAIAHNTKKVKITQDYTASRFGLDQITQTEPNGDKKGSYDTEVSLTVGSGGPSGSVSWKYNQPESRRVDKTNSPNHRGKAAWKYFPWDKKDHEPFQVEVGSKAIINDLSRCEGSSSLVQMGKTTIKANFDGWWVIGDTYEIGANYFVKKCY